MKEINENSDPVLYTVDDVQRIFKLGKNKAYELLRSDGFPSIKLNKRFYVSQHELCKWIAAQKGRTYRY